MARVETIPDAFGTGQSATMFAVPSTGSVMDANFPELNWGVMPNPYIKTSLTHTGSFAGVISAKTQHPEEAKLFVKYLTSAEGFLVYYSVTKTIPGRISLQSQIPELQEGYLKLLFDQVVAWGQARTGGPALPIVNEIIHGLMLKDIALGGDIEDVVTNAVIECDAQLAQFK